MGMPDILAFAGVTVSLASLLIQIRDGKITRAELKNKSEDEIVEMIWQKGESSWAPLRHSNALAKVPDPVYSAIYAKLQTLEATATSQILKPDLTAEEIQIIIDEVQFEICRLLAVVWKSNGKKFPNNAWEKKWQDVGCHLLPSLDKEPTKWQSS